METFNQADIESNIESVITNKTADNSISPTMLGDTLNKVLNHEHVGEKITITNDEINFCVTCDGSTISERIIQYLNLSDISNYKKHGEIWIEYIDNSVTTVNNVEGQTVVEEREIIFSETI